VCVCVCVCVFYPANASSYVIEKKWEEMKKKFLHLFYFYKSLELYILTCVRGFVGQQEGFFFLKGRSDLFFLDNPVIIGQTEVFFPFYYTLVRTRENRLEK
jgi:hypothetical protein